MSVGCLVCLHSISVLSGNKIRHLTAKSCFGNNENEHFKEDSMWIEARSREKPKRKEIHRPLVSLDPPHRGMFEKRIVA